MTRAISGPGAPDWLTIHEASALVGVSPATLRRWCDAGDVRAFTTPGGHRRFARSAVLGILPAARRGRPTVSSLGDTADRLARVCRQEGFGSLPWPAAVARLSPAEREPFRTCGQRLVEALVQLLDAPPGVDIAGRLAIAGDAAAEQGRIAARAGVTLGETIELFLRFRGPLLHELGSAARRTGLDAVGATGLLEAASDAIDRLVPPLVAGYEQAALPDEACQPAPATGPVDVPSRTAVGHDHRQAGTAHRRGKGQRSRCVAI